MRRSAEARAAAAPGGRTIRMLALGVALPTLLLALGWGYATVRERALREERERAEIEAMLDSLVQAIDEGLEELRAREDERPYYVWGHYFSPPDVLSLTDPVAVSPLASGAADPRVVGYFQLAPDGLLTTPYAEGSLLERSAHTPREEALIDALTPATRAALAALLAREPARVAPPATAVELASLTPEPVVHQQQRVSALELNAYGSQLAQEINRAQSGDPRARDDLWARGRAAPQVARRTRTDEGSSPASSQATLEAPATAQVPPDATRAPPVELDYTPMRLEQVAGVPMLVRTVGDGASTSLQGVVLSREAIEGVWLPRLVSRFVLSAPPARLVQDDAVDGCAASRVLRDVAPALRVCVPSEALSAQPISWVVWLERGLALGLVLIVALALFALERAAQSERALSRQKSQFVSAVSHELRTPLTTIRLHAEMLADDLVEPERRPRVHEELVGETVRLTRLVENVLEASRLEEGRRPLRARTTDLRAHVRAVVADLDRHARGKGFELVAPADAEPLELSFDPGALEQVVVNLVDNAIKYVGQGERRIEVEVEGDATHARVRVRDAGEGIPDAEKRHVFERFHRIERPMQAHQPGTGLGLSIVRELVLAHAGTVVLSDRSPRGLEVIVSLPRR